jgi:DNA-binding LacI/PurR family transcriptional regulator
MPCLFRRGKGDVVGDRNTRRRVTAADIAQVVGVSRATVGFVLNDTPGQTISAGTRKRVLEAAADLGYRPFGAAQALVRGGCRIVLFLLPDRPMDGGMWRLLREATDILGEAGYSLVTQTRHRTDPTRPLWELVDAEVAMSLEPFDRATLASLRACGITKVFPDPANPAHLRELASATTGVGSQIEYLHTVGHRRVGLAATMDPRLTGLNEQLLRSARRTAHRLGLDPPEVQVVDHLGDSGPQAVRAWIAAGATAVAAYNDDVAAAVVGSALRAGLCVPDDLSVMGHGDTPIAAQFLPALSSVRIDPARIGRYVAEEAIHLAGGGHAPLAAPEAEATVIVRESTGPCSPVPGRHARG